MGYPISYRGRRSPQRAGPRGLPQAIAADPPLTPGPWLGLMAMTWMAYNLGQALQGLEYNVPTRQTPGPYGWTKVLDCGLPPARLPAAARTSCGEQLVSFSAWESEAQGAQNPLTATTLNYWDGTPRSRTLTGYRVAYAQRWTRGLGQPFSAWTATPKPGVLLGGPVYGAQNRRAMGVSQAGYSAPAYPVAGRLPGFDILDNRWQVVLPGRPGSVPQERPDSKPLPRPVPRTVPAPLMKEVKVNLNSRAGRAFVAMYAMFNLLGDAQGFTRALWFALPKEERGSSMRWRNMARDIYRGAHTIDWLEAAKNVAQWKFLDTLYGGTQGAMFEAIGRGYSWELARVWSTLDSEINATWGYEIRRLEREQQSSRGG